MAENLLLPVHVTPNSGHVDEPRDGIALCLSGGGYRAMLFHVGCLWRLNDAGLLGKLSRISSVSGGSITSGVLGMNWTKLGIDTNNPVSGNFKTLLVDPIRNVARRTIDVPAGLGGIFLPGTISEKISAAYEKYLYGQTKLKDLPDDTEGPRFIFNATNVMTGAVWRFSRPYMGDWRVGLIKDPDLKLSVAIAASSAFPPFLSPLKLDIDPKNVSKTDGADLQTIPYTDTVVLSDGGVYDNMGLETAFKEYKTLLVSDAGQNMAPDPAPKEDWARHSIRVMELLDNQVRNLRKRQLLASYQSTGPHARSGTYWSIRSLFSDFAKDAKLTDPLNLNGFNPQDLAGVKTRLKTVEEPLQEQLINWGYAICDTAIRRHAADVLTNAGGKIVEPAALPFPNSGI